MKVKISVLMLIIAMLLPTIVFANSAPIYIDEYPTLSIAPIKDCTVEVEKEELTFKIDEKYSDEALVTAKYYLKNTSKKNITVPMVFPYISDGYNRLDADIRFNEEEIPYEVYSAGNVDVSDYLKEPEGFSEQVDINKIIENLNKPSYKVQNFDDTANTTLYKVTLNSPAERQCNVDFNINPNKTRILTVNFSGVGIDQDGDCTVHDYVNNNDVGKEAYILVLGEDTLTNIECNYSDKIEKSIVNTRDFIFENIIESKDGWYNIEHINKEGYYNLILNKIDSYFTNSQLVFSKDIVVEDIMANNNIYAFLYKVILKPESTNVLTVTYSMNATIDREESSDFVNTFAYILNPARNFSDFGGIDIRIELNTYDPYIINSSIPLNKDESGVYKAALDSLPDKDLVFSTYSKEEIDFLERTTTKAFPHGFISVVLFFIAALIFITGGIIGWFFVKKKYNR